MANRPPPPLTGTIEISHSEEHGVFIGGAPDGLRSLAGLLIWLAEVDQEADGIPEGERTHVHLHAGPRDDIFASLTEWSQDTEICRLDAKGTGALPPGPAWAGWGG